MADRYFESLNAEALASLASMEGLDAPASAAGPVFVPSKRKAVPAWYAYIAAAAVAGAALLIHQFYKPLSAAILAILLGAILRNLSVIPSDFLEGCKGLIRKTIPATIVLTGATLNLTDLARGMPYLAVVAAAIATGTLVSILAGRLLGVSRNTSLLVGAGTSICGNSAIISVAPVVRASDDDLLLSIGAINILGLVIMILLPLAGGTLGMSPEAFGVWAGATVHAVPQAVTTGFAFGAQAGALAALVKLVRVTMLAPYVLIFAVSTRSREQQKATGHSAAQYIRLLPPFLWGFTGLAVIGTLGLLPELVFHPTGAGGPLTISASKLLGEGGTLLLTLSMAGMGLEVNLRQLLRTGGPALATGALASVLQCAATWAVIRLLLG